MGYALSHKYSQCSHNWTHFLKQRRKTHGVMFIIYFAVLVVIPHCLSAAVVQRWHYHEERGVASVVAISKRRSSDPGLHFHVTAFGKIHRLDLVPASRVFSPNLEEYQSSVDGNDLIEKLVTSRTNQENLQSKLYIDSTNTVSLFVEERNGQLFMDGILSDEVIIETEIPRNLRSTNGKVTYVVYRRIVDGEGSCEAVAPNMTTSQGEENLVEIRSLPALVQPELFLVIDYKISSYFNFNLEAVKKYLAIFYNSVNRRFDTISVPKIQIAISGILLIHRTSGQPFMVSGSSTVMDAGRTLNSFGRWMFQNREVITTKYDVSTLITGLDLGSSSGSNNMWLSGILGVAYIGSACLLGDSMNFNVGIGEDVPGRYTGIHTHTHELAHLFGASHDGSRDNSPRGNPGALECHRADGYIMSYDFGSVNKFFFSTCSIKQIYFTLSSQSASCLIDEPKDRVVSYNGTLPGSIFTLTDQCKIRHGSEYYFYEPNLNEVCVRLWCAKLQAATTLSLSTSGPALEGSNCSNHNYPM